MIGNRYRLTINLSIEGPLKSKLGDLDNTPINLTYSINLSRFLTEAKAANL